jgi:hypothetical protein
VKPSFSAIASRYEKARTSLGIPVKVRRLDHLMAGIPQLKRTIASGYPFVAIIDEKFLFRGENDAISQHAVAVSGYTRETIFASDPIWRREMSYYFDQFDTAWGRNNYSALFLFPLGTRVSEDIGEQRSLDFFSTEGGQ